MKKRIKGIYILLFLSTLVCMNFVSAGCEGNVCTLNEGESLTYSDNEFSIEYFAVSGVNLNVNGLIIGLTKGDTKLIDEFGIKITLNDFFAPSKVEDIGYVKFTIEKIKPKSNCVENFCTLYEGETISYEENNFEIAFISYGGIKLKINGEIISFGEGSNAVRNDFKITVQSIFYQDYVGGQAYTNFTLEEITCEEEWSCTDWSSCINEKQTRTCTDSNSCGTTEEKPDENQVCSIDSKCNSNEDCIIQGTGQPYCNENKLCIPSIGYECKNPGTENSYCAHPEKINCEVCENGCANGLCLKEEQKNSFCEENVCILHEREVISYGGNEFEIAFIGLNSVKLKVDGINANTLIEGDSELIGEIKIMIEDISVQDYEGGEKYVKFKIENAEIKSEKECGQIGIRYKGQYCSPEYKLTNQIVEDEKCDNSFECESNLCLDNKCVSGSLIQKIISWFKRIFN